MCMTSGWNPQINFCNFFVQFELSHVLLDLATGYHVNAIPPTILPRSF